MSSTTPREFITLIMIDQEKRKKLIISADDFGISPKANRNILELAGQKKIDRVAVIADGDMEAEEIQKLLAFGVKLDIHLDSVEQISHGELTKQNNWRRLLLFLAKYCTGKLSAEKMEKSWIRQIEKFKEKFGRYPDGLNSHQHIHYFPIYFKIALKLHNYYNIPYIRFGKIGFLGNKTVVKSILFFLRKRNRSRFIMSNCPSSDYMVSLDWISDIDIFLKNLPDDITELVCHPERDKEFEIIKNNF